MQLWKKLLISGLVFFYENSDDMTKEFYKRAGRHNYYLRFILGKIFSFRKASWWFDLVDKSIQHSRKTKDVCIATGRKHYFGEILERNRLIPLTHIDFEGIECPVFKDIDYYLKILYGDYMQVPPPEKREKHFVKKLKL